jgi:hypothetical protein
MLHHPIDLELHARHIMWLEKIAESEPMASLLKKGGERFHQQSPWQMLRKQKKFARSLWRLCTTSVGPVL